MGGYNGCGWQQLSVRPPLYSCRHVSVCMCVQSSCFPTTAACLSTSSAFQPSITTSPPPLNAATAHLILKVFPHNQSTADRAPGGDVLLWWNPKTHPVRKTHTQATIDTLFPLFPPPCTTFIEKTRKKKQRIKSPNPDRQILVMLMLARVKSKKATLRHRQPLAALSL